MTAVAPTPALGSQTTTWGPVLSRVGGLPADAVDLVGPRTAEILRDVHDADAGVQDAAEAVVDALFELVPRLDDDVELRRRVLAGKRVAHRADDLPWDDPTWQAVAQRLPDGAALDVERYRVLCAERARLLRQLDDAVAADRDRSVAGLYALLDDERYLASLAVAAPDWLAHARPRERRRTTVAALKTVYSYAVRASLKTSPFSGLTTVAAAGSCGSGRRRTQPSLVLAARALSALARDPSTAALLRFRLAPTRPGGDDAPSGVLLRAENLMADGVVWRHDRVVPADAALRWVQALADLDEPFAFEDLTSRLGGDDPFTRYLRLLDTGVVRPVPPWHRRQPALPALAKVVGDAGSPISAADLLEVHTRATAVADSDPPTRVAHALRIQELTRDWGDRADLGVQTPSGWVYEDCESEVAVPDPLTSPVVRSALDDLASSVRPQVFRSHVYDHVVRSLVAEYGRGGVCDDPLGFLMRLSLERDVDPALQQAQTADLRERGHAGDRAFLPVGATSAPPSAGVLVQLAGDEQQPGGEPAWVVVNHFAAGSGALSARFTSLLPEAFTTQLRAFVREGWGELPCRELLVWTDCNNAQAQCSGLLPPLLVPGEPDDPAHPDGLRLTDTRLVHDPVDDTVFLVDPAGQPFGLTYLGLTPQHLLQGYLRLLVTIANPWVNGAQASDYTATMAHDLVSACGDDVVHLPRRESGRLVTRRESWVVPVALLVGEGRRCDAAQLRRLHALRTAHGMPDEVFVHQLGGGADAMLGDAHKPTWVSFASTVSLEAFWQWLRPGTTHVRVVEALPSRRQHLQVDRDGRPRVTEHAAFVRWGRPGRTW
ncbi:MAG TPA: hypothetical protein VHO27_13505 [Angustibacter sp.]|nr:hypothetical protein [Angustibacter sp.]